jgi:N-acetylglucosaminyldiphosphoundecaprenol N-acetyl-beta-D-mannosaminyltransferase
MWCWQEPELDTTDSLVKLVSSPFVCRYGINMPRKVRVEAIDMDTTQLVSANGSEPSAFLALGGVRARRRRVCIGPVEIDSYSLSDLLDAILRHALYGTGMRQIVTVNAQLFVLAEKSARFRACLKAAGYVCADGLPIVWACNRFARQRVPRVAGVDLIDVICRKGAADHLRVFFLGGQPNAARAAAEMLSRRYPGLEIAGVSCPELGFETSEQTLRPVLVEIANAKPHIVFVGLGAPKQEFFIDQHIRTLKVPIAIGIGGSFEILSGALHRAPQWMQSIGLEWLFRLGQEPGRLWKRYLIGNVLFLIALTKWRLHLAEVPLSMDTISAVPWK